MNSTSRLSRWIQVIHSMEFKYSGYLSKDVVVRIDSNSVNAPVHNKVVVAEALQIVAAKVGVVQSIGDMG